MSNTEWNKLLRRLEIRHEVTLPDGCTIRDNGSDYSLVSEYGSVIVNTWDFRQIKALLVD